MDLVQSRIVTDDVERLAAFYARLMRAPVVLNDYYVEVPTTVASVGFSRRRFTEYREAQAARPCSPQHQAEIMLDFRAGDVDAERFEELSPEQFRRAATRHFPAPVAEDLLKALASYVGQTAYMTADLEKIIGRPATSYAQWAAQHAGAYR